jgi:DNA-binding CsgD family transcriptional regulator/tetratricopeptide (TPR) repeat protein
MQDTERIIGRDREIAQLDLAVGPGSDGLRLVLLTGPSGRGKTTLTHVVAEHARERGFTVALANGRAGSLSTPFAPWIEALPSIAPSVEGSLGTLDMEQVGNTLTRELVEASGAAPLLLVCDDAQAFDESSIALLPYACGVAEQHNITVLLVEQTDAVEVSSSYRSFIGGLVGKRVVQNIELGPMTDEGVDELARELLGLGPDEHPPVEIVVRAQGNPWFVRELAAAYQRGETDIPVSIAAAATSRLHRLDTDAQDVVSAIAVCRDGAYLGWLERFADQDARGFAQTMEAIRASGLVREDGELLFVAHPLMRQALLEELSAAMKRALHQELADIIPNVPMAPVPAARAYGYHLGCAGRTDEAVVQFVCAAEANEALGQLHEAVADYARCLEAEPRIEQRMDLLRRAAFAAMQLNDERAPKYWAELARLAAARSDDEQYAYALYQQYWTEQEGTAIDRLERAAGLGPELYGWSARAAATLCTLAGDYEGAVAHDERALALARENADRMLETVTLEKIGLAYSYLERLPEAIECLRESVQLAIDQRLHSWALFAWGTLAECLAENLETEASLTECRAALAYAEGLELAGLRPWVLGWLGLALIRAGMVDEALQVSAQARDDKASGADEHLQAFVTLVRANVTGSAGDTKSCGAIVDEAVVIATNQGYESWLFETKFFQARYLAQIGRADDALAFLDGPMVNEAVAIANVAQWLARTAASEGRDELLDRAVALAEQVTSGVPLVGLMLEEVRATRHAMLTGATDDLCAVADRWQATGRPLDAWRALISLALADGRHGRVEAGVTRLRELRASFTKLGMDYDANVAAARLRSLGARSRARSSSTTVGNLTQRELEIARLVSSGMKNAEVAQQLYLAEKTVAAHLSNIYGKVEVRSRLQLAAWLKQHDEDAVVA